MGITSAKPDALHPVSAHEGIDLIDVVRGFALFGVLLAGVADPEQFGPDRRAQRPVGARRRAQSESGARSSSDLQ